MLSSYRIEACRCVSVMGWIRHDPHKEICVSPTKMAGTGPTSTVDRAAFEILRRHNQAATLQSPCGAARRERKSGMGHENSEGIAYKPPCGEVVMCPRVGR